MNEITIKNVKKDDAKILLKYIKQVCNETDNLTYSKDEFDITLKDEEKFIKETNSSQTSFMILAILNKKIVGCLSFTGNSKQKLKHLGEFGVSVLKEYWNLGIASKLIEEMINSCKQKNITKINLMVRSDNKIGIKLYKKFGFITEGKTINYFKIDNIYYDMLHMGKIL